jgi:hypothetical protein
MMSMITKRRNVLGKNVVHSLVLPNA